ncbi:MAG: tetratricopeptide repeat protein, partial [Blastocatellia bacterium]
MSSNFRLIPELLWRPVGAMKQLCERAPVVFALLAAWLLSAAYALCAPLLHMRAQDAEDPDALAQVTAGAGQGINGILESPAIPGIGFYTAGLWGVMVVLYLAAVYTPTFVFIANLWSRRMSFAVVLRDEFAPAVSGVLCAWTAALLFSLPVAFLIGRQAAGHGESLFPYAILLLVMPLPVFLFLAAAAARAVFQLGWGRSVITALLAGLSLVVMPLLMQAVFIVCASPFLALFVLFLLRDRVDDFFGAHRARQSLRQNLQAATLNPADASAHYQLGLLYQKQGDHENATASFRQAVTIDPTETDAWYQMGRIAREQGRAGEAIAHFNTVVQQNDAHGQHEIWREIALTYRDAGQHQDALAMLDRFLAARPSDAEGRYWRGMTL